MIWDHQGNRTIRKGDWKLVSVFDYEENDYGPWELYNIENDPSETNNLVIQNNDIALMLEEWYIKWTNRVGVIERDSILQRREMLYD